MDQPRQYASFWGSTQMDLDAQSLVDALAIRWDVETSFEYAKDLLGNDRYEVMSAQAITRFWTLIACLLCFLEERRASANDSLLTCGEVRRSVQQDHCVNLLQWLADQIRAGVCLEQISCRLALSG